MFKSAPKHTFDPSLEAQAKEFRESASVKAPEGSISLTCIFSNARPPSQKKMGKKDPPRRFSVIVTGIAKLSQYKDNPNYRVDGPGVISIPHYNHGLIRSLKKDIEDKEKKKEEVSDELRERYTQALNEIKQWTQLRDGQSITCATFAKGNIDTFKNLQIVTLIGFDGDYSEEHNGNIYVNYNCSKVVPKAATAPAYVELSRLINLDSQTVIEFPAPEEQYGKQHLLYFRDYFSEVKPDDGSLLVTQRRYTIDSDPSKFKVKKDDVEKIHFPMTIFQKQSDGIDYWVNAMIFDQDTLNQAFGIPDKDTYSKIMPNHPVPLVAVCSVNLPNTRSFDNGNPKTKRLSVWVNSPKFFLREYVLGQCPPITYEAAKQLLCKNPKQHAFVTRSDPGNPSKLNEYNLDKSFKFVNDKIVNVSYFSGDLDDLNNQGCEWRVMLAKYMDDTDRFNAAQLSPEEGTKMVEGTYVIYAVMPFSKSELDMYENPNKTEEEEGEGEEVEVKKEPNLKRERTDEEEEEEEDEDLYSKKIKVEPE